MVVDDELEKVSLWVVLPLESTKKSARRSCAASSPRLVLGLLQTPAYAKELLDDEEADQGRGPKR